VQALPWAALGVLGIALSVALTRGIGRAHARLAMAMLGPTAAQRRRMETAVDEAEEMSMVAG
jgi:hypothetical protein